jgi:hypothetical protein
VPEFNLDMIRRFLKDCDEEITKYLAKKSAMAAPMGPAAPMPGAGPTGGLPPPPGAQAPAPDLPGMGIPQAA